MGSYILVIVVLAKSYANGTGDLTWPIVTTQEFADKSACNVAAQVTSKMANTKNISVACVPKAMP